MARRRNDAFWGDSGTMIPEQARDEIEHGDEGAGHKGNNVDFSQRYAGDPDEYTEQAERITRSLERSDSFKYSGQFSDPEKRREFVEQLADELAGRKIARPAQPQEKKEEPMLSRKADDKFWASDEPKKQMPKRL